MTVILFNERTSAADNHLCIGLSFLVEQVFCMKIDLELSFVIAITYQDELVVLLQFLNLMISEVVELQLFANHISVWSVNSWKVDEQRDGVSRLACTPQLPLKMSIECRLSRSRITHNQEHLLVTSQEILDFVHQWKSILVQGLQVGFGQRRDKHDLVIVFKSFIPQPMHVALDSLYLLNLS